MGFLHSLVRHVRKRPPSRCLSGSPRRVRPALCRCILDQDFGLWRHPPAARPESTSGLHHCLCNSIRGRASIRRRGCCTFFARDAACASRVARCGDWLAGLFFGWSRGDFGWHIRNGGRFRSSLVETPARTAIVTNMPNQAVDTDAQGRPRVPRSDFLGRRSLLRYTASKSAIVSDVPRNPVCGVGEPQRALSLRYRRFRTATCTESV